MRNSVAYPKRAGQASLELTVAWISALLLLIGSVRVFMWLNTRLVTRHQAYDNERARTAAASWSPGQRWNEPTERLDILGQ